MCNISRATFGMYGGPKKLVKIQFENSMCGVFLDRFGKDITIRPAKDEGWSAANVDVALSEQFLGWIFSLGTNIRIIEPAEVVERFAGDLEEIRRIYSSFG